MHHMHIKTLSEIFFFQICFLGISMGDRLEARIGAIENIQEEFGHDIREVKEHLARLTNLFEDHIKTQKVHSRGQSPFSNQRVPRPFIQTPSYLPCETDRPTCGNQCP